MRSLLVIIAVISGAQLVFSGSLPLTESEISLMLRSGYSNEAILRELSSRHFADTFNAAAEKKLTKAGANAALLDALRGGSFQASADEIAAAQQKITALEETQEQAVRSQNARGDRKPNQKPQSAPPASFVNEVYRLLKGDLVCSHQGSIVHFDDEVLEQKKYFLFFFSANWSPTARRFTPTLIEYYNRITTQHPELEVIFFSADRSQFGMETYLRQNNMPWPAVDYPKIETKAAAMNTKMVKDLPCLILVDAKGHVLSQTGTGASAKDPEKVLTDVDQVLAGAMPQQVARSR